MCLKVLRAQFRFVAMGYFFICNMNNGCKLCIYFCFCFFFHRLKSSHFRDFFVCGKSVLLLLLLLLLVHRTHAGSLYNVCSSFLD